MPLYQIVLLGAVGGALPDLLRIINARHEPAPDYLDRHFFWFSLGLLMLLGAGAACLLDPTRTVDALAVGYSAPSLLSKALADRDEAVRAEVAHALTDVRERISTGMPTLDALTRYVDDNQPRKAPFQNLRRWWAS